MSVLPDPATSGILVVKTQKVERLEYILGEVKDGVTYSPCTDTSDFCQEQLVITGSFGDVKHQRGFWSHRALFSLARLKKDVDSS